MHVHCRLTGSVACSLVSVVLFNLNQLTWTWSVTAEVFGLNNLFVTLLLFLLTKFEQTDCPNVKIRVRKHLFINLFFVLLQGTFHECNCHVFRLGLDMPSRDGSVTL